MGGLSSERAVSLKSGAAVTAALNRLGYDTVAIDVDHEVATALRAQKVEVAFNALHGRFGEDGTIQGLLEIMHIPYTGSGVLASALGMNKAASRHVLMAAGLVMPSCRVICLDDEISISPRDLPVVVKPVAEGSSVGVSLVFKEDDFPKAVAEAFQFGQQILVEPYIRGMEVAVGVLNDRAIGAIEIRPKEPFYNYTAKYVPGMSEHVFPAPLPPSVYENLLNDGLSAHRALGCKGYSRSDFIVREGTHYLLEVNTLPGMTETSLLPEIARGVGIEFDEMVERILISV